MSYRDDAFESAVDTVREFMESIIEQKINGDVSDDLYNDYDNGDAYHHENHVDKDYDLVESAAILDDLDEFEETDYGLWEGLDPRQAVSAQAAYTYGNAVYSFWREIIEEINSVSMEESETKEGIEQILSDFLAAH